MYNQELLKAQLSNMVQCPEDNKKSRDMKHEGRSEKSDTRDDSVKTKNKEISEEIKQEAAEYREAEKRLHEYLNKMTLNQQQAGLPVRTKDGRIDMDNGNFLSLTDTPQAYSTRKRERHRFTVNNVRRQKREDDLRWRSKTPRELQTEYRDGENLEVLILAILDKSPLSKFCYIIPTSELDDYEKNDIANLGNYKIGTDFILFDKQTGNLIAGFDDVSDEQGDRFKEKKERLKEVKEHGGTTLTYGLGYNEARKIIIKEVKNVPVLYLAISSQRSRRAVKNFNTNIDAMEMSQDEKQLFVRLYTAIDGQVCEMRDEVGEKLDEDTLNSEYGKKLLIYRERLKNFQKILEEPELKTFVEECKKVA